MMNGMNNEMNTRLFTYFGLITFYILHCVNLCKYQKNKK